MVNKTKDKLKVTSYKLPKTRIRDDEETTEASDVVVKFEGRSFAWNGAIDKGSLET